MNDVPHFIDTNVPMYAVGTDHPLKQPCLAILEAVARDELDALTSVEVLQEILHRYTAIGQRARAVEVIRLFVRVVPSMLPVTRDDLELAMEIHLRHDGLQARDAVHAAVMHRHGIRHIISADQHFDDVPEIVRRDPSEWSE